MYQNSNPDYSTNGGQCQEEIVVPSFAVYREVAYLLAMLPTEQAGAVIQAASRHFLFGETGFEMPSVMAADAARKLVSDIDRGMERYRQTVESNKRNIRKRWTKAREA